MGNILAILQTPSGIMYCCVAVIIITIMYVLIFLLKFKPALFIRNVASFFMKVIGKGVRKSEEKIRRDLEVGLISQKRAKYKFYRLLHDLTIDLGLSRQGVTPYELLFMISFVCLILSLLFGKLIFGTMFLGVIAFPIITAGAICTFYTKANIAHDNRIEAVLEAENTLCNNMKDGIRNSVKASVESLPKEVKVEFRDFLIEIENGTYIVTALLSLNNKLGSISDEFINRVIKFETKEEKGTAEVFQDLVEINNYKINGRIKMKKAFEDIQFQFIMSVIMILVFLVGTIIIYEIVRTFYFNTGVGNIVILIDLLLIVVVFVYLTWIRAQDL